MFNKYTAKVGDKVKVKMVDGNTLEMTVYAVQAPGGFGRAESSGPRVMAWIRPGGFGIGLDAPTIASVESL